MMDTAIRMLRPHSRGIVAYADNLTIILAGDSRVLEAKGTWTDPVEYHDGHGHQKAEAP